MAGEARAAFFSVGPSDILSKFVGESEASIRGLFREGESISRYTIRIDFKALNIFPHSSTQGVQDPL